ncbi:WecB/TagA/CpsF family glycosyltransferase [Amorphoplanes digitatis]|uniref:N-acetylglucosaminyldiphosphoundecaprenol N-acetyl-beta-D-mannosaminyltransferase n=1 Tax=Actinoplanes digitatis TaxID=1868 RepID=A0A7W7MUB3_9ACTN|nr:WecB/TagA/CpsF family glycosyltransferase [Actinoplanes digitatis]MBB4766429.1 N-acetylglucosaminyldiphosphoundecaprenol N-acetyl-beta-D-mannosaminyltransferase [Actinoplanes digitatis]GID96741.1 acetyl-mannosamine transferase [Actinoplanes digitatis]
MTVEAFDRVHLDGTGIDRITEAEVVAVVREAITLGRGGRILTPNVDILRQAQIDAGVRVHLDDADLIVADGMPLVWASRLSGTPLPERIAGSSLIWSLSRGLGHDRRSIFVIGGAPGADGAQNGAARAADRLARECPGLRIAGTSCPQFGFEKKKRTYARFLAEVVRAKPDLVFVGLGFPKQEKVITRLRAEMPKAWFIGCGAAVNFVAGDVERAPLWMQRTGLEWAHRLGTEPGRLAKRYLKHDAPYAMRLLAGAASRRR